MADTATTPEASRNLNRRIEELLRSFNLPDEVSSTIGRAMAHLGEEGVAPGLDIGDAASDFRLPDATGRLVSLKERLSHGPVIVKFYRGAWCPICNLELRALQELLPEFRELGASLIAISPQRPDDALTLQEKNALAFDVLSDPSQQVIRAYGLQFAAPDEVKAFHRGIDLDLTLETADGSWNLPVPATFVLDRRGIVRARHVDMDYTKRMEPRDILETLVTLA